MVDYYYIYGGYYIYGWLFITFMVVQYYFYGG